MKINEHSIITTKTARYFTLGTSSGKTINIWFVLHGYGNLAADFINNFEIINKEENYIVAPEAHNKFYLKGFYGKVGATWMTKENREDEIRDYINFLDSVYETEVKKFDRTKIKITVLGFSQGATTAARWLVNGKIKADNFVMWAGDLPADSQPEKIKEIFNSMNICFVAGDSDNFINKERLNEEIEKFKNLEIDFKLYKFEGGHEIDKQTLLGIVSELNASN